MRRREQIRNEKRARTRKIPRNGTATGGIEEYHEKMRMWERKVSR
jgi:hypothetical protein